MSALEEIRARFAADRFAVEAAGVQIMEAEPGRCLCRMALRPIHCNAAGWPMGGAVFTLADFAFAVAANAFAARVTVSQQVSITFLSPAKGEVLTAEARCLKAGRTACFYQVEIRDETGAQVACASVNGFALPETQAK